MYNVNDIDNSPQLDSLLMHWFHRNDIKKSKATSTAFLRSCQASEGFPWDLKQHTGYLTSILHQACY